MRGPDHFTPPQYHWQPGDMELTSSETRKVYWLGAGLLIALAGAIVWVLV